MKTLKLIAWLVVVGGVFGNVLGSIAASTWMVWYNTPGGKTTQAMCDCAELVRSTTDSIILWQTIGTGIGAVMLTLLGLLVRQATSKKAAPAVAPPSSPAPPAK